MGANWPRGSSAYYNVSLLDPLTGQLSHSSPFTLGTVDVDNVQYAGNAVFAAATSSLMLPMQHYPSQRQWLYFNTRTERVDRVGSVVNEGRMNPVCSVRDETAGITWDVSFAQIVRTGRTVFTQLWQYNDDPRGDWRLLYWPAFNLSLPFDESHPATGSCAFNQAKRLLYVQMNGQVPLLHTIDIGKKTLVSSIAYPTAINGTRTGCYGLAYSDKSSQLYTYVTDDGGLTPMAVQLVDPSTGDNTTLIDGVQLNVTWANQNTFDDVTGHWFLADSQGAQVYSVLSPSTGDVVTAGYIDSEFNTVWATAYASTSSVQRKLEEAAEKVEVEGVSESRAVPVYDARRSEQQTVAQYLSKHASQQRSSPVHVKA